MVTKTNRRQAQQTFRQFAWNLAGTIASGKAAAPTPSRPADKRP